MPDAFMSNLATALTHLSVQRYRLALRASKRFHMPQYKGSALRGILGHALRRTFCAAKAETCDGCMIAAQCVYCVVMESPVAEGHALARKYRNAPNPYVIEPADDDRDWYETGDLLRFDLLLVGRAAAWLPSIVLALSQYGTGRGTPTPFTVASVACGAGADEQMLFQAGRMTGASGFPPITFSARPRGGADSVTLTFETPVRVKQNDSLVTDLQFPLLVRSLAERIALLAHFHCGAPLADVRLASEADGVAVTSSTLQWRDWKRYSSRQQTSMKLGGLVGTVTYAGDLTPFLPLLLAGEVLHAGKATAFGLGKYHMKRRGVHH